MKESRSELSICISAALFTLLFSHTPSTSAADKSAQKPKVLTANYSNADCMAIGEWSSKEECFSKSPDYANCAESELRCSPYKKMYVARKELETLQLQVALLADQLYGHIEMWDREYLADLKNSFQEASVAWSEYRDKECLAEQFISGTTRGNQLSDMTESCRLDATNERIKVLKKYIESLAPLEASND